MIQVFSKHSAQTEALKAGLPLNVTGAGEQFTMSCANAVSASAQVLVRSGTGTAWVFSIIVSNDPSPEPTRGSFELHPTYTTTLTNSAKISAVFSVAGYMHFGVRLTTLAGSEGYADILLVCKDSPA